MPKVKTSIYVDKELWGRFRRRSSEEGKEVTKLLEEAIEGRLFEDALQGVLSSIETDEMLAIDFEPVSPRGGDVSGLVRVDRDRRAVDIPGQ
ncbi:MAG: CopG family transcriptional regulator [Nitrososphaerota archaeon]|nr:CopG family transcriptional regulator [Nitrososphaerota archaeon]MDG7012976.1 CopG family transcriptional regulator [Nitrososphaerota archaeon]MDG7026756.1 CopG family transcriptional regulator [Nitrososphaerota archaeon]